ncbi:hypothetical protein CDL12_01259 [Handroanthus impetiginosus]|uniref:H15 domain-containing protein n=1 Tax=Handroanthus impetiginosus TaxID=429701 RepID=A0A2G9I8L6_9LAMI|nr:hypothetical protein CDL12_01259 [Handroanthus impetiginosus]
MKTPTQSHSSRPNAKTLVQNSKIHIDQKIITKAMEKFQEFVFKIAETHRNAPLALEAKKKLQSRLNQFFSQYKTPDHPPYSAMIERALRELNEKGGSSEESISQFLKKEYSDLPWAHLTLLKHHLGRLCESGDIVVTLGKRYMLAAVNPSPDSSSKSNKKPSRKRKGKWRWDGKRKRNKQKGDKVEVAEKCREYDVQEQQLTEDGVNVEHKQVKEDQTKILLSCDDGVNVEHKQVKEDQTKISLSCDDGEYGVFGNPRSFPTELQLEEEQPADKLPELATPERPPGFESVIVQSLSQFGVDGTNECYRQEQATITPIELGTLSKSEDHHSLQLELSNVVRPQYQENTPELTPITEQQQQQEEKQTDLLREDDASETKNRAIRTYSRRGKAKSQQPQDVDMKLKQVAEPPSVNPLEPNTIIDIYNLSLASKFEVAKDEKSTDSLRPEHQCTVYRLRSGASKLKPVAEVSNKADARNESPCYLEIPQPPKPELDAKVQQNFAFVDYQSRQDLEQADKSACSAEVEAVKIEELLPSNDFTPACAEKSLEEQLKPPWRGRLRKRRRRSAIA